jgi:hypothetical protein
MSTKSDMLKPQVQLILRQILSWLWTWENKQIACFQTHWWDRNSIDIPTPKRKKKKQEKLGNRHQFNSKPKKKKKKETIFRLENNLLLPLPPSHTLGLGLDPQSSIWPSFCGFTGISYWGLYNSGGFKAVTLPQHHWALSYWRLSLVVLLSGWFSAKALRLPEASCEI